MGAITTELLDRDIKRDEQGRKITPAERRAELVAGYRSSGLTMEQFGRREGINRYTLAKWATQLGGKRAGRPMRFEEIKMGLPSGWAYEVTLPNGMVVRAANAAALVELVGLTRK